MTKTSNPKFRRTLIIGPGLIGSSLARAFRAEELSDQIIGYDANPKVGARAEAINVIDQAYDTIKQAIVGCDLVVIAAPIGAYNEICNEINNFAEADTLIIDVGSVKGAVTEIAQSLRDDIYFVPCHPISGTEQSGPDAGFAELFRNRWCILTPLARDDDAYKKAVGQAEELWRTIGADVEIMDAAHHDVALAVTSHLPHLIAFILVGAADDIETVAQSEVIKYSAGGFRDFTRIAASDPIMWRDVFLHNRDAVLETLGRFSEELALMQRAIRWGDGEALEAAFSRGRALRREIVAAGQETPRPNFGRDPDAGQDPENTPGKS